MIFKVILVVTVLNILVTAAKQILDNVAAGSKADQFAGQAAGVVAKILSFLTANTQAPAPAPAAAEAPKA